MRIKKYFSVIIISFEKYFLLGFKKGKLGLFLFLRQKGGCWVKKKAGLLVPLWHWLSHLSTFFGLILEVVIF